MLSSDSVLVVGGAESFQSGIWVGVKSCPKAASDLLDCISAKEICFYAALSFNSSPRNFPLTPTAGQPGKLWFSAKSIQCCIGTGTP